MDAKGLGKRKMQLRGGKRKNAGRKSAYDEPTKTVSFRCPLSKINYMLQLNSRSGRKVAYNGRACCSFGYLKNYCSIT